MKNVSVVLTCYNGAQWIGEAIKSVLAQTYRDFELLIIDDGSTDHSKEIVASHLSDERVRYIYQRNKGFSAAVNRGIKESSGSLISFIGQDDLWMPNKLQLQVKYLCEHKDVDLVHSSYFAIHSQGRVVGIRNRDVPDVSSKRKLIEKLFLRNFIGFETVLLKKKCFDEVGFLDEQMVGYSDHDIWIRIAGKFKIGYLGKPLVKKRQHELQLSKLKVENALTDEFLLVKKTIKLYPFLQKLEKKKLAFLYYWYGLMLLEKGNVKEAKFEFLKSIKCEPLTFKSIMAYINPKIYLLILNFYVGFTPAVRRGLSWVEG